MNFWFSIEADSLSTVELLNNMSRRRVANMDKGQYILHQKFHCSSVNFYASQNWMLFSNQIRAGTNFYFFEEYFVA